MMKTYMPVTNTEELTAAMARTRQAQEIFSTYTQEQVQRLSSVLRNVDMEISLDMKNLVFQEFSDMNHYKTVL